MVLLEHLAVDPGTPVVPLHETDRREFGEVAVPLPVPGEEDQMGVVGRCAGRPLPLVTGAEGQVGLEPEDGPDAGRPRLLIERPGRVKIAVVGHRQAVHAQFGDPADQVGNPVGSVEERVLRVGVQMDEAHRRLRSM